MEAALPRPPPSKAQPRSERRSSSSATACAAAPLPRTAGTIPQESCSACSAAAKADRAPPRAGGGQRAAGSQDVCRRLFAALF